MDSSSNSENMDFDENFDSSEEEELKNEKELLKKESVGFIADEEEEEDESSLEGGVTDKDAESESDIEDEIANLIDKPIIKRGRLQIDTDDEDEEPEKRSRMIDDDDDFNEPSMPQPSHQGPNLGSEEEDEEEDMSNFIVDANERPAAKKRAIHDDPLVQEAQDLFGVDLEGLVDPSDENTSEADSVGSHVEKDPVDLGELFDPAELDRGFYTVEDEAIKKLDIPERFQLRAVPFEMIDQSSNTLERDLIELENEAKWIYNILYDATSNPSRKDEITGVIKEVLNLLKVYLFEPPFIATYRKEYMKTESRFSMKIDDLWNVYFLDEQWIRLRNKKNSLLNKVEKLIKLMEIIKDSGVEDVASEMQKQLNITEINPPHALLEFIKLADTMEALNDCMNYFNLYFKSAILEDEKDVKKLSRPTKFNPYTIGQKYELTAYLNYFGLNSSQFAEHVRDQYARFDCENHPMAPSDLAEGFISSHCPTTESVLKSIRSMLSYQISCEPEVRKYMRNFFKINAHLSINPTKRGKEEIDEAHPLFRMKYLIDKSILSFENNYDFLYIDQGSQDQLVTYDIYLTEHYYTDIFNKYKMFFHRDEFNIVAQQWNEQRKLMIKEMLDEYLIPIMSKEIKHSLLKSSQDALLKEICEKIYNKINVKPFIHSLQKGDVHYDKTNLGRILSLTYNISAGRHEQSHVFALIVDGNGEVLDKIKLTKFIYNLKRRKSTEKDKDLQYLSELIVQYRPHVCAIAAENLIALDLQKEVQNLMSELENQYDYNPIPVELVDNELAIVYQNSKMAELEFQTYPPCLRQAVSLARLLQDPLTEFARLMNVDQDLLNLQLHPLQNIISKDNLYRKLEIQFVNVVNAVGVDINNCITHKHRSGVLQFVSGLGSRKADYLIKTIDRNLEFLPSRNLIIQNCDVGPKVGMNCLGFIKINHASPDLEFDDDMLKELLDGTRVHPESYELAKKMAADAMDWDDGDTENMVIQEILDCPEKLKDLDLEAFAEELKKTDHGPKLITLNDIRKELTHSFEDYREHYRSLDTRERFELLTKESVDCFEEGTLVQAKITRFAHKRPHQDQLDQASPKRDEVSGYWICPFCLKSNFAELNNIWYHFDTQECPGKIIGVYCELTNGIRGFLNINNLSDQRVQSIFDHIHLGMLVHARIIRIDLERIQVELTTKSSDLQDTGKWCKRKDSCFNDSAEDADKQALEEQIERQKHSLTYINRVIFHEFFRNYTYQEFIQKAPNFEVGDFVIRPSSKGCDHLTISWKVEENVYKHIDILEKRKVNDFSLGRLLLIDGERYEDLDEIIASYIQPMVLYAREVQNFKYYRNIDVDDKDLVNNLMRQEKEKDPKKIPYLVAPLKSYPGGFVIIYMPEQKERIDMFKVTPKGFIFRYIKFHSFMPMIHYFKLHFNDKPSSRNTPSLSYQTPIINTTPQYHTGIRPENSTPESSCNGSNGNQHVRGPKTPKW